MDPKTLMMAGTTALEFGAKFGAANALKQEGKIAASIERRNADAETQNIADLKESKEFQFDLLQIEWNEVQAAAETAYAYSGVDIGRGTPVHMFVDNARIFETQKQAIAYNTNLEINKAMVRRDSYLLKAVQSEHYYKSRARALKFDAFAGVIKGGSDIYERTKKPADTTNYFDTYMGRENQFLGGAKMFGTTVPQSKGYKSYMKQPKYTPSWRKL
mgnify:FL=1|tara:strand:+ start:11495 stop:12142 length:648 start_codon:yes stop_codon:yes gene_type:complete